MESADSTSRHFMQSPPHQPPGWYPGIHSRQPERQHAIGWVIAGFEPLDLGTQGSQRRR